MAYLDNLKAICEKHIKNNAHHVPYTGAESFVVMKSGATQLELHPAGLVVSGGWFTNWIILYGIESNWAADGHIANKAIRDRITQIAQAYTEITKEG